MAQGVRGLMKRLGARGGDAVAAVVPAPPACARLSPTPAEAAFLFDINDLRRRPRHENEAMIRRLCDNAYLGDATALCRILGRYKLFVDTLDIGLSTHLLLDGYWETWVTEAMLDVVRPGMVALDIGANLGYYTLLLADLVGPGGRVHAFEPNPAIMTRLQRSVAVNGFGDRVALHAAPLGAEDGTEVALVIPEGEPKNAHIVSPERASGRGITLHATTLDAVIGGQRVDFIKIDAEGAERAIWQGMRGLLARGEALTIFLEFAASRYADAAGFLADIRAAGFALAAIDPVAGVAPIEAPAILARPGDEDWMLVLTR